MSLSGAAVSFSPTVVAPDGRRIEVESFRLGMTSMPALRADSHCRIAASTWARNGVDVRNEGLGTARAWGTRGGGGGCAPCRCGRGTSGTATAR